ncbi:hypothetical protein QSV08_02635 [Maribacter sp. BPC-D8]|uniref:hypothetical protein n=1 Tax=Maribacter sp. BPC-D8 TaxID=3053613 RepID=UPI002B47577D|nr:hypothetical protein [Maribacter sp. BPC-D8]WRI30140.1 hypothetical protein QSV08_02635 [Maribacter sp. BPC-D8]
MNIYILRILILSTIFSNAQEKIEFNKNPYTNENHFIIKLQEQGKKSSKIFYDVKEKKNKYGYEEPVVTVNNFKSIIVEKENDSYNLTLQLDADGVLDLDLATSANVKKVYAFVFNDTIYQTKKFSSPSFHGQFLIKNISKKQKNNIVNFYKSLPNFELQLKLYHAIDHAEKSKIDSLLNVGALLTEINYKIGYNQQNGAFYSAFCRRRGTYFKYQDVADYLLSKGFIPKAITIDQAIAYRDVKYINNYFNTIENKEERCNALRRKLWNVFRYGNASVIREFEILGLNIETEKHRGKSLLANASIRSEASMVSYLLNKKIAYDEATLLIYSLVYNKMDATDALLEGGLNINTLLDNKNNIAQKMIAFEYIHKDSYNNASVRKIPLMIERGFNPNTIGNEGKTLLHTIASNTNEIMGFRVKGKSSFTYDESECLKQILEVVKVIKSNGGDFNKKDDKGFTAYEYVLKQIHELKSRDINLKKEDKALLLNAFKN